MADTVMETKPDMASTWMTALYDEYLKDRCLYEITLPGTHDAGCYIRKTNPAASNAITQTETIFKQLVGGIRYFDLRPYNPLVGKHFVTYHGPGGVPVYEGDKLDGDEGILSQIDRFMKTLSGDSRELVILNMSHFSNFSPIGPFGQDQHERFIEIVRANLSDHLVCYSQDINLFDMTYRKLLSSKDESQTKSRVVIIYDGALDQGKESYVQKTNLPAGFFKVSPKYDVMDTGKIYLFDQYANKNNINLVRDDQCNKLKNRSAFAFGAKLDGKWQDNKVRGCPKVMHLFSWTLTDGTGEPLKFAKDANPELLPLLTGKKWAGDTRPYDPTQDEKINIIYVDDYASEKTKKQNAIDNRITIPAGTALPVAIAVKLNGYQDKFSWEDFG